MFESETSITYMYINLISLLCRCGEPCVKICLPLFEPDVMVIMEKNFLTKK